MDSSLAREAETAAMTSTPKRPEEASARYFRQASPRRAGRHNPHCGWFVTPTSPGDGAL